MQVNVSKMSQYHTCKALIGPSLLACDMSDMKGESIKVLEAGADYLHLDVMDGHFVPNLTFGAPIISCLRKHVPNAILDVHLMVSKPAQWVSDMKTAGADIFTFHIEIENQSIEDLVDMIKASDMKVGIALKPATPVESVYPYLSMIDQVLVMTVEPGFGGQSFMSDMMPKVATLRDRCPCINIQVDGGLAASTIDIAATAGANMIVAGSAVFKNSPANVISILRRSVEKYGNGKDGDSLSPLVV